MKKVILFSAIETEDDRKKAERLYEKYKSLMYREAYKILKNKQEAEDAVMTAFVRIINNLHKIDEKNHKATMAFLVRICVNVAKSRIKNISNQLNNEESVEENIENPDTTYIPHEFIISQETNNTLKEIICSLKPVYQEVILLRYYSDFSVLEISEVLDEKTDTVKKRLLRAKKIIAKEYEKKANIKEKAESEVCLNGKK